MTNPTQPIPTIDRLPEPTYRVMFFATYHPDPDRGSAWYIGYWLAEQWWVMDANEAFKFSKSEVPFWLPLPPDPTGEA